MFGKVSSEETFFSFEFVRNINQVKRNLAFFLPRFLSRDRRAGGNLFPPARRFVNAGCKDDGRPLGILFGRRKGEDIAGVDWKSEKIYLL